jgi:hypothetical protein
MTAGSRISAEAGLGAVKDTFEPDNQFDAGQTVYCQKVGSQVTISWPFLYHDEDHAPNTSTGVVPPEFRPSDEQHNSFNVRGSGPQTVRIRPDGTFKMNYKAMDGTFASLTNCNAGSITFLIHDEF